MCWTGMTKEILQTNIYSKEEAVMAISPYSDPFHVAHIFQPIMINPKNDGQDKAAEEKKDDVPEADSRDDSTETLE